MKRLNCLLGALAVTSQMVACDVDSTASENEPVDLGEPETEQDSGVGADAGADAGPSKAEPRGFIVVHSDYASAEVSVVGLDGEVLSRSLLSSGSEAPGLSLPLSADVVLPTQPLRGDSVVLIDRRNNVLSWVDPSEAEVTQQVGVGPGGFLANPYDYVEWSDTKAFVARYETNSAAGAEDLDQGGDLLVMNPRTGELSSRVDLAPTLDREQDTALPRPDTVLLANGKLYVTVVGISADFQQYVDSRVVSVDPETEEVLDVLVLEGFKNCGSMALSPDAGRLAVGCMGDWVDLGTSGIVLIDIEGDRAELVAEHQASDLTNAQVGGVDFASNELVLFSTLGAFDGEEVASPDVVSTLNTNDGEVSEPLLEAAPFALGETRCAGTVCVVANSDDLGLHFFDVSTQGLEARDEPIVVDAEGLPPRYVGVF